MRFSPGLASLCAASLLLCGCLSSGLPEIGQVPAFTLTGEDGQPFQSNAELAGKIWVADFFFTTCNGPCPRMTALMKRVQEATREFPEVQLVSFTVDPKNDTPEKLREYAGRFRYDAARWHFLTGDPAELTKLSDSTFHLGGLGPEHGTRFALVDRKGRIRAYYETSDSAAIRQLVEDITKLRKEVL
ncbi:MAG: SCO family protein [Acidobacteria bacterium]|nr:SCO family protein [Acidobacteriota bacterium]